MKHLKRFDEELDPQKYIRVGNKLKNLGKTSRGSKLVDYGFEKAFGFYNVHLGHISNDNWSLYTAKLTNPECKFYYDRIVIRIAVINTYKQIRMVLHALSRASFLN